MNIWKEIKKRRLRQSCRPVSATPLIEMTMELSKKGNKKEKAEFIKALKSGFEKAGIELCELALLEGLVKEKDIQDAEIRGLSKGDMGPVIQGMMTMRKHPGDPAMVVTCEDSSNYKNRVWIKRRFGVKILGTKQALKLMEKELKRDNIKMETQSEVQNG